MSEQVSGNQTETTLDPQTCISLTLDWIEAAINLGLATRQAVIEDDMHLVMQGKNLLLHGTKTGTMRDWMLSHDRTSVDALQIDITGKRTTVAPFNGWAPLDRTVNAHERATAVLFDGSTREYRGCRVILSSADALLVADNWHAILYVASAGVRP